METLLQDLRYGFRMLRKSPAFSVITILMLALGIGANTAMFSIIDAIALRPLAVEEPVRIVRIGNSKVSGAYDANDASSWPEFQDFRAGVHALAGVAGSDRRGILLRRGNEAQRLLANVVTPNYFEVLRVKPVVGRVFSEGELTRPDAPHMVLFSYAFWDTQYNSDPQIVGRTVVANGVDCLVLGVLPRDFRGTELFLNPEIYVPLPTWDAMGGGRQEYFARDYRQLQLFGLLRVGATAEEAQTELAEIQKRLAEQHAKTDSYRHITVKLDADAKGERTRAITVVLFGISGLVFLIACANATNLLLARGEVRRKEMATRLSLGASRTRLLRQSLTESLVLALAAGMLACLLAGWVIRVLPALMPPMGFSAGTIGVDFRMDARVFAFALLSSLLAVILAGLFPAFSATRVSLTGTIKEQAASEAGGHGYLRNGLVVSEVAISAVLLIATGLLLRTLVVVHGLDPGFDTKRNMLIATLDSGGYSMPQVRGYFRRVLERLLGVPGVQSTAFASRIPMWISGGGANRVVWVPGIHPAPGEEGVHIGFAVVTPGYFSTIGTRLVRGRPITSQDQENSVPVAVVNETAARMLWGGAEAVGQHFKIGGPAGKDVEVVGVAQDGRYSDLTEKQRAYMFMSLYQESWGDSVLIVRTMGEPGAMASTLRQELAAIDHNVAVLSTITMEEYMRSALFEQRSEVQLTSILAALGLILASVGLYGVVAFMVTRRTHEIGIRLAVGAQSRNVFIFVLKRGLVLTGAGLGIGLGFAAVLSRYLATLLYGVSPSDPLTYGGVIGVVLAVALVASSIPARRATKVDPIMALKSE